MTEVPGGADPAAGGAPGRLDALLRSIRQGDILSFGAVAIVGTHASEILRAAGDPASHEPAHAAEVASVTIESASGWHVVLTQDCDIVRPVAIEPCLHVAPVVFIDEVEWRKLDSGQTSYRQFALPPDRLSVLPPGDPDVTLGRKPVVDIRYVTSVDKTALLTAQDIERRAPLGPHDRLRFRDWLAARYGRTSFEDRVAEDVLPRARDVLDTLAAQLASSEPGQRKPAVSFVGAVSEWYVRQMDLKVEFMARMDDSRLVAEKLMRTVKGEPVVDEQKLLAGAKAVRGAIAHKLPRECGYSVAVTFYDFAELSALEYQTYTLWVVQDDPEPAVPRRESDAPGAS